MEVSGQLHDPTALPPGKEPLVPLKRSVGGPQSQSERDRQRNCDGLIRFLISEVNWDKSTITAIEKTSEDKESGLDVSVVRLHTKL
jgi:hypothetical protein